MPRRIQTTPAEVETLLSEKDTLERIVTVQSAQLGEIAKHPKQIVFTFRLAISPSLFFLIVTSIIIRLFQYKIMAWSKCSWLSI